MQGLAGRQSVKDRRKPNTLNLVRKVERIAQPTISKENTETWNIVAVGVKSKRKDLLREADKHKEKLQHHAGASIKRLNFKEKHR